MRRISLIVAAVVAGILGAADAARADIAPGDACASPGQPCQVAGPNYDQAGVCVTATCTKLLPNGDGGVTTTTYVCNRCQQSGGGGAGGTSVGTAGTTGTAGAGGAGGTSVGTAGTTGTAGAGGSIGGAGGTPPLGGPAKNSKSSGCAVAGSSGGLDLTALLLLALMFARRARATNG